MLKCNGNDENELPPALRLEERTSDRFDNL